eukprot:scaffold44779_cov60-Phaeocystis_antarctica.AAC.2
MSCSAATVSSSAISASATSSVSCTRSGPELVAGAKRAGAIGAARPRFAPVLSGKNHCRPASIHLGCGARCSAIGGGALGAAWCCRSAPSRALAALDGGPGGSEGSRDFDDEASESPEFLVHLCSVSRENCVGPVSHEAAVEQHESSNEQYAEGQQCP